MKTATKVQRVDLWRERGMSCEAACQKVGISGPTYYAHKKAEKPAKKKKSKKPELMTINLTDTSASNGKLIRMAIELLQMAAEGAK